MSDNIDDRTFLFLVNVQCAAAIQLYARISLYRSFAVLGRGKGGRRGLAAATHLAEAMRGSITVVRRTVNIKWRAAHMDAPLALFFYSLGYGR